MSTVQSLEPGSRHDLRVGLSPDAPDEDKVKDTKGRSAIAIPTRRHRAMTGPGLRVVLFVSGCLLALHLLPQSGYLASQGRHLCVGGSRTAPARRLRSYASQPWRGPDDIGRRADGAARFHQEDIRRRKEMGLHTAIQTSGFLGDRATMTYLSRSILFCSTSRVRIPRLTRV